MMKWMIKLILNSIKNVSNKGMNGWRKEFFNDSSGTWVEFRIHPYWIDLTNIHKEKVISFDCWMIMKLENCEKVVIQVVDTDGFL